MKQGNEGHSLQAHGLASQVPPWINEIGPQEAEIGTGNHMTEGLARTTRDAPPENRPL